MNPNNPPLVNENSQTAPSAADAEELKRIGATGQDRELAMIKHTEKMRAESTDNPRFAADAERVPRTDKHGTIIGCMYRIPFNGAEDYFYSEESYRTIQADLARVTQENERLKGEFQKAGEWNRLTELELNNLRSIVSDQDTDRSALIDQLDLNRDEFLRIKACSGADDEIKQLCDRSQQVITQRVPVIQQRNDAEKERDQLRSRVAELEKDRARMDWLEKNYDRIEYSTRVFFRPHHPNLRTAIDTARQALAARAADVIELAALETANPEFPLVNEK